MEFGLDAGLKLSARHGKARHHLVLRSGHIAALGKKQDTAVFSCCHSRFCPDVEQVKTGQVLDAGHIGGPAACELMPKQQQCTFVLNLQLITRLKNRHIGHLFSCSGIAFKAWATVLR